MCHRYGPTARLLSPQADTPGPEVAPVKNAGGPPTRAPCRCWGTGRHPWASGRRSCRFSRRRDARRCGYRSDALATAACVPDVPSQEYEGERNESERSHIRHEAEPPGLLPPVHGLTRTCQLADCSGGIRRIVPRVGSPLARRQLRSLLPPNSRQATTMAMMIAIIEMVSAAVSIGAATRSARFEPRATQRPRT